MGVCEEICKAYAEYGIQARKKNIQSSLDVLSKMVRFKIDFRTYQAEFVQLLRDGEAGLEIIDFEKFRLRTQMNDKWKETPDWFVRGFCVQVGYGDSSRTRMAYKFVEKERTEPRKNILKALERNCAFFENKMGKTEFKEYQLKKVFNEEEATQKIIEIVLKEIRKIQMDFLSSKRLSGLEKKILGLLEEEFLSCVQQERMKRNE